MKQETKQPAGRVMRAYLSVGSSQYRGSDYALQAESEARRILAETEPIIYCGIGGQLQTTKPTHTQSDMRVTVIGREYDVYRTHEDLAESLTAFLAAPDPAAYLRSKQ